jgi:hypothetical protein
MTWGRSLLIAGFAAIVGAILLAVLLFTPRKPNGEPIPGLNNPDSLVLYSIDGTDDSGGKYEAAVAKGEEVFQKYLALGKVEIKEASERAQVIAALQQAALWHDGPPHNCFWPRHAIVAIEGDHPLEIVVCFQCRQYMLDGRTFPVISRKPEKLLNDILKRAGVPIAP